MIPKKNTSDIEAAGAAEPRPPYMLRKAIEAVKGGVRIEAAAADHGDFKLLGSGRLLGRCVSPQHLDRTPSLTIYTDSQSFKCYGCQEHGDVLDLEMLAGGHSELWSAVIALATRFGVDLPRRPQRWHDWNGEKGKRHDALRQTRARLYQRRFLGMFRADLEAIPDPKEREEEARRVYEDLYPLAYACAVYREEASCG